MEHLRILFSLKSILKFNKATITQSFVMGVLFVFSFSMLVFFTVGIDKCINRSASNDNRTLQITIIEPSTLDKSLVINDIISLPLIEDAYYIEDAVHGESIRIVMNNYYDRYQALTSLPPYFEKLSYFTHRIEGDLSKILLIKRLGGLFFLLMLLIILLIKLHFVRRIVHENSKELTLAIILGFNQLHLMTFFTKVFVIWGTFTLVLVSIIQAITYHLIANPILSSIDFFTTYEIDLTLNFNVIFGGVLASMLFVNVVFSIIINQQLYHTK